MTTLLPPGVQKFTDANNVPLAGGSIAFYVPSTLTPKNTWADPAQVTLNTNPVILDASGSAIIYGSGAYRSILKDSLGNTIYDQLTASTDTGGIYSGGTTTGTAANQIIAVTVPSGFALTTGNQLTVIAGFTATGATTLNAAGTGAKNVLKPGPTGPIALVAGDFGVGDALALFYDGTQFQLLDALAVPISGGTLTGPLNFNQGADIASAGTINLQTATGNVVNVTGTTGITAITLSQGASRRVQFTGILTLTNGANLILPGGANITTSPGDFAEFQGYAAGVVRVIYERGINRVAQIVNVEVGTVATGTTVIPYDNTIPQNTEGDQYMSLAITPTNAASTLIISVVLFGSNGASPRNTVALFQDATANALAAASLGGVSALTTGCTFTHKMTAGTTSATTFKVRAGPNGAATFTFNGESAAQLYGGVFASSITVTEVLP